MGQSFSGKFVSLLACPVQRNLWAVRARGLLCYESVEWLWARGLCRYESVEWLWVRGLLCYESVEWLWAR